MTEEPTDDPSELWIGKVLDKRFAPIKAEMKRLENEVSQLKYKVQNFEAEKYKLDNIRRSLTDWMRGQM